MNQPANQFKFTISLLHPRAGGRYQGTLAGGQPVTLQRIGPVDNSGLYDGRTLPEHLAVDDLALTLPGGKTVTLENDQGTYARDDGLYLWTGLDPDGHRIAAASAPDLHSVQVPAAPMLDTEGHPIPGVFWEAEETAPLWILREQEKNDDDEAGLIVVATTERNFDDLLDQLARDHAENTPGTLEQIRYFAGVRRLRSEALVRYWTEAAGRWSKWELTAENRLTNKGGSQ